MEPFIKWNRRCLCVILLLTLIVYGGYASKDETNGCTNPRPTPAEGLSAKKPVLPNTYEVHTECIIINKNQSTEIHEFYDYDGNRGVLRQRQAGETLWLYYDYDSNELIEILKLDNSCQVKDLSKDPNRFLFGYQSDGTSGHIFSAAGALRFGGNIDEIYVGSDVIRGIKTRKWYSCLYWSDMDATMDVWWHFSDPNNWDTALGLPEIPIRAYVKGIAYNADGAAHNFEHIYDFIHFKNFIAESDVFETPSLVTCPNRKNTKPFPDFPDGFSFTTEIIDTVTQSVSFQTESFDRKNNATKLQYTPSELVDSKYGYRPLTEIHDFNTGVAYIIDDMIGNCSVIPIEQNIYDNKNLDSKHIRMKSSSEFFNTDGVKVTYEGVKTARNLPCDTWVGRRNTDPKDGSPLNSTWEWYFKTDDWTAIQQTDEVSSSMGTPVQIRYQIPVYDQMDVYNIFGFSQEHQDLMTYDISSCYNNKGKINVDFQIPDKYKVNVDQNNKLFLYFTLVSLAGYMDVSPLRISHIRTVYTDKVHVQFELLDIAPTIGDIATLKKETPMNVAVDLLKKAIDSNDFVILLVSETEDQVIPITVVSGSLESYTLGSKQRSQSPSSQGYGSGSMAGLAIGMMVSGGLAGVLLAFKFYNN